MSSKRLLTFEHIVSREERVEAALEFAGSHLAERGEEDTQVITMIYMYTIYISVSDPYSIESGSSQKSQSGSDYRRIRIRIQAIS